MTDDIEVVYVEATGAIYKHPARYSAGNEWTFPIRYTLADGRTFDGTSTHRRMKDAKAEAASLPGKPTTYTTAIFHGDQFVGTCIHYGMITAWPVNTLG